MAIGFISGLVSTFAFNWFEALEASTDYPFRLARPAMLIIGLTVPTVLRIVFSVRVYMHENPIDREWRARAEILGVDISPD